MVSIRNHSDLARFMANSPTGFAYRGRDYHGTIKGMGVEKMSVSFDLELGAAIRASATGNDQSVSAWLAEAAVNRLRLDALGDALQAWEGQFGALSEAEVAVADAVLTRAARRRRRAA